jgi:hypothetical protein
LVIFQLGGQFQVEMVKVVHHLFDGKIFADELLSAAAKALAQRRVAGELEQPLGDGGRVAGADQKTGFPFETDFVAPSKS